MSYSLPYWAMGGGHVRSASAIRLVWGPAGSGVPRLNVERLARFVPGRHELLAERPPDAGEVVVAVPDRVVLEHELGGDRGIAVEGGRRRPVELLVGQPPDGCGGRGAVAPEQVQRLGLPRVRIRDGMPRIHRVDVVD